MPTAVAEPEVNTNTNTDTNTDTDVTDQNPTTDPNELPNDPDAIRPTEDFVTPRLDQFVSEIAALNPEVVPPAAPAPKEEPKSPSEPPEVAKPAEPSHFDLDVALRDPNLAPRVNSELDKRAAALSKRVQDEQRAKEHARTEAEARERAEREYAELVELANSTDDLSEEVLVARKTLAEKESVKKLYASWEKQSMEGLRERVYTEQMTPVVEDLVHRYSVAYDQIPELKDASLRQAVHHDNFPEAENWLTNLINTVADARVAAEAEKVATTRAEALYTERMAEQRTHMPSVDTTPRVVTGERTGTPTWRTASEVEAAYLKFVEEGTGTPVTPAQVRWARSHLPYL